MVIFLSTSGTSFHIACHVSYHERFIESPGFLNLFPLYLGLLLGMGAEEHSRDERRVGPWIGFVSFRGPHVIVCHGIDKSRPYADKWAYKGARYRISSSGYLQLCDWGLFWLLCFEEIQFCHLLHYFYIYLGWRSLVWICSYG